MRSAARSWAAAGSAGGCQVMLVIWSRGRRFGAGLRWHSRHQLICSERHLGDGRHLVDAPVAGGAPDALVHVDRVVEVREVRKLVDPVPLDGGAGEVAPPDRLELRALVPDLGVAVEAHLGGGNARRGAPLHVEVAVPAVDQVVDDVVPVVEEHRLRDLLLQPLGVRRAPVAPESEEASAEDGGDGDEGEAGEEVRGRLEECAHSGTGLPGA